MTPEEIEADLKIASRVLDEGGIILYPTDTIWGLGCDACSEEAVERLFALKSRPGAKAMISLVDSLPMLFRWVGNVPGKAREEIENPDGHPLTVIYDNPEGIAPALKADDGSAAFRIPQLRFTRELCRRLGRPIVSTSANISGHPAAKTYEEIAGDLKEGVDYICRYGRELPPGSPSRILKITDKEEVTVIR